MEKSTVNLELISRAEYSSPTILNLGSIETIVLGTGASPKTDGELLTS